MCSFNPLFISLLPFLALQRLVILPSDKNVWDLRSESFLPVGSTTSRWKTRQDKREMGLGIASGLVRGWDRVRV